MELRFSERWIIAANALLIVLLAYLAAITINDIIGWRLGTGAQEDLSAPAPAMAPSGKHPRTYYEQIVRRDIFNMRPTASSAPVATEDLRIKLLGTSLMTAGKPFAIIEDLSGAQDVYQVGDDIPGAGRLVAVELNRAIIDRGGRRVAIEIPDTVKAAREAGEVGAKSMPGRSLMSARPMISRAGTPIPSTTTATDDEEIKNLGPNHYSISRNFINESFLNLADLAENIRATPNVVGGKVNGFALAEIESGSVFGEIGLKNGDIITQVDGRALNDPSRALAMIPMLHTRQSVQLQVLRGGKPVTLKFDMR
jgi:type II secretion system protein C